MLGRQPEIAVRLRSMLCRRDYAEVKRVLAASS